ncbi:hypothetical protein H0H93_004017 [Arthromyces matolae]|nr:hypothetical protein H0H93_004017 [Arthromyces matolae]
MSSNTISLPSPGNYAGALHNYMQERKQINLLSWVEIPVIGNPTQWTVHCKINGEIKGTGVALQKAAAKQAAAKQACEGCLSFLLSDTEYATSESSESVQHAMIKYLCCPAITAIYTVIRITRHLVAKIFAESHCWFPTTIMQPSKEKPADLNPSPLALAPFPPPKKHNSLKRTIGVFLGFIAFSFYVWSCLHSSVMEKSIFDMNDFTPSQCAQADVRTPVKNGDLWDSLSSTIGTNAFRSKAVEWIAGAVRVPTESYDDMGPVGEDPRWNAFGPFHDYLLEAFPLVHSSLSLQKINTYGLIFTWRGSDSSIKPLVLMGHQDVVPVNPETVDEWTHPPYSGYFDGTNVWGRGSSDDKSGLIGALASVEMLIKSGFKPTRTLVLSFGFDEEISGPRGAGNLAKILYDTYGKDGVAYIVDEGVGYAEIGGTIFATPGIAEKGYVDVRVEVTSPGGHSSVPPKHTSIGILSSLLVEYEKNPYKTRKVPLYSTLQCAAKYAKDLDKDFRKTIKRAAKSNRYLRKLEAFIAKDRLYASLVGTTQAIDVIEGGVKANALPERAFAVVNHRISVISSVAEVQAHNADLLAELAQKFNLTYKAFGQQISAEGAPNDGSLTLSDAYGTSLEPAPVTPTSLDAIPWNILSGTIKAAYNSHRSLTEKNEIIVGPGMMSGNTGELSLTF